MPPHQNTLERGHKFLEDSWNALPTIGDVYLTCGTFSVRSSRFGLSVRSAVLKEKLARDWTSDSDLERKDGLPNLTLPSARQHPYDPNGYQEVDIELMHEWMFRSIWFAKPCLSSVADLFIVLPRLYGVADTLGVPGLKDFVLGRFSRELRKNPRSEHFAKAVRMVYTLPEMDGTLHDALHEAVASWTDGPSGNNDEVWTSDDMVDVRDEFLAYSKDQLRFFGLNYNAKPKSPAANTNGQ